jgi:hypothetical protein
MRFARRSSIVLSMTQARQRSRSSTFFAVFFFLPFFFLAPAGGGSAFVGSSSKSSGTLTPGPAQNGGGTSEGCPDSRSRGRTRQSCTALDVHFWLLDPRRVDCHPFAHRHRFCADEVLPSHTGVSFSRLQRAPAAEQDEVHGPPKNQITAAPHTFAGPAVSL